MWTRLRGALTRLATIDRAFDEVKFNQGLILSALHRSVQSTDLRAFEFKVYSQWGEDGIIQHLIDHVEIKNTTFIEFGVEDFSESNCRFLLMKDAWHGYVIDGSPRNIARLKHSHYFWKYQLRAASAFITRDNILSLLGESGFDHDLGLLSVDIDGIDYFVLECVLTTWRPRVLIVEYNALFGPTRAVSVPYDAAFRRTAAHQSNLYYGASLRAFSDLAATRGYSLVGVNTAGNNAFFVRGELLPPTLRARTVEQCFRDSSFREARNAAGRLTFASGDERMALIGDLAVVDVHTGDTLRVRDTCTPVSPKERGSRLPA